MVAIHDSDGGGDDNVVAVVVAVAVVVGLEVDSQEARLNVYQRHGGSQKLQNIKLPYR